MPAARWIETATDLSDDLAKAATYLTLDKLAQEVRLSPNTIRDSMLRPPIENSAVARGAICRPAGRIGGVLNPTPLWSTEQVDEYWARKSGDAEATPGTGTTLTDATPAVLAARDLVTIAGIASELDRAVNTIRRYARDYRATFPEKVTVVTAHRSGPPRDYRDIGAVADWVLAHEEANDGDQDKLARLRAWITYHRRSRAAAGFAEAEPARRAG